jgi:Holliday junction resolvase-like predicted endonuclease
MPTPVDIGQAGERSVVHWLTSHGFTIQEWNTQAPGSTDIRATAGGKTLLVQVKSAVAPSQPTTLSPQEETNIKARAANLKAEAWEATVLLTASLQLSGEVIWRRLF